MKSREKYYTDEQICFVEMKTENEKMLTAYVFDEKEKTISPIYDAFEEEPTLIPVEEKDGSLWVDDETKVLRLSQMIDKLGMKDTLRFFKNRFKQPAYECFFEKIFNDAIGGGVQASTLAKVNNEILRSQLDHKTPAQNHDELAR